MKTDDVGVAMLGFLSLGFHWGGCSVRLWKINGDGEDESH